MRPCAARGAETGRASPVEIAGGIVLHSSAMLRDIPVRGVVNADGGYGAAAGPDRPSKFFAAGGAGLDSGIDAIGLASDVGCRRSSLVISSEETTAVAARFRSAGIVEDVEAGRFHFVPGSLDSFAATRGAGAGRVRGSSAVENRAGSADRCKGEAADNVHAERLGSASVSFHASPVRVMGESAASSETSRTAAACGLVAATARRMGADSASSVFLGRDANRFSPGTPD